MALVVFLRGVNVGGHRRFRPTELARQLRALDVVNIGAAGTFVVRERATRTAVRAAVQRKLPFEAQMMICAGADILRLAARDPFAGQPCGRDVIQFVSVLARRPGPRRALILPFDLPETGPWGMRVLEREGQFVIGVHRRDMQAIGYLGRIDRLFGLPATTRSWNTFQAISRVLTPSRPTS